jgi:hypothetical protein
MSHITKSKFARGGGSHNINLLTPTGRRAVDIRLVKIVYLCFHCLSRLKTHNAGIRCELNSNHYGYIHRDEADKLTDEERFMKLSDMFPSEYLRGIDIGNPVIVTIKAVTAEQVRNRDNNRMEQEFIMRFEELEKKLRLNVTMAKEVAKIVNDPEMDTDNWTGKRVTIYRITIKAFGQEHIVPRIRQPERGDVDLGQAIKSAQPGKPKQAANGSNSAKVQQLPVKAAEVSPVDKFFAQVQAATDNYYGHGKEGKGKEHLYNTIGGWPNFSNQAEVDAKLSAAVDHANEKRQQARANEVAEDIMGDTPWDEIEAASELEKPF